MDVEHLAAIVLTHLDTDHFKTHWLRTIVKQKIRLFCHRKKVKQIVGSPEARDMFLRVKGSESLIELVNGFDEAAGFEPVKGVRMEPLPLAHDEAGSHGFVISCDGYRVGYATDLGHVPEELIERFCGADAVLLEANYDPEMEQNSPRPYFLKQRIMGGKGHLSNGQALSALQSILDRTHQRQGAEKLPRHIVLMHRSRQCNCPKLVEGFFKQDERIARVLTLAHQAQRTPWLSVRRQKNVQTQMRLTF